MLHSQVTYTLSALITTLISVIFKKIQTLLFRCIDSSQNFIRVILNGSLDVPDLLKVISFKVPFISCVISFFFYSHPHHVIGSKPSFSLYALSLQFCILIVLYNNNILNYVLPLIVLKIIRLLIYRITYILKFRIYLVLTTL